MPERPLILFPEPIISKRSILKPNLEGFTKPSINQQYERLRPNFLELQKAIDQKNIIIQNSPDSMNPEFALVFEIYGTVESFYKAIKKINGFEWMFDFNIEEMEPSEYFYSINNDNQKSDKLLTGKVYCIMTNQNALKKLLSLWNKYNSKSSFKFPRGYTGLRNIFCNLKTIRKWNAQDRIDETGVQEYWKNALITSEREFVSFEIDLFYRRIPAKRQLSSNAVANVVASLGGKIIKECTIVEIAYHSMLVSLPKNSIQQLLENYTDVPLSNVDDIVFFRPICQTAFKSETKTIVYNELDFIEEQGLIEEPIIAIFDGMPLQNHPLLRKRLILDDPDNFAENYVSKYRFHGTAMASLVLHGDVNQKEYSLNRKVYFRPILKLKLFDENHDLYEERFSPDEIQADLIHRAVKRLFSRNGDEPPFAPKVKIINLSLGDPGRIFLNTMSPIAKLLDWLSHKYRVMFIVSAGNHNTPKSPTITSFEDFKALTLEERSDNVFKGLKRDVRNLKVLSPAESINSLTIGATFFDRSRVNENDRLIFPVKDGLPSPISSFGFGYNNMIKPELFYSGGRKFVYKDISGKLCWQTQLKEPGCKVAAPYNSTSSGLAYTFGTSAATAQVTHEAGICYDILSDLFKSETNNEIPDEYIAILIKAMIAHGATWGDKAEEIARYTKKTDKQISQWFGYGVPDFLRVKECAKNRITMIGIGALRSEEAHIYKLPLPFDFYNQRLFRRLTATLAYFSPISPTLLKYRTTLIWFEVKDPIGLFSDRQNTEWQKTRKGTLQHEIFSGNKAVNWDSSASLEIKVNCKEDAERNTEKVQYSLFITFEVAEELDLDVYSIISTQLKQIVPVRSLA